ncbi:DUF2384 domain-containing protein [Rugamonas sp. FT29W]|uniref:DUF2384 domain-containing protein n=1 Tax=Rugamonas aquatica TaxID=2743357 RepID=A0A6A7N6E6_9BURK|nr:DUF2384 domain-containing protein [Rugamonas aquatica]
MAGPLQRIATIKEGVQARRLGELSTALARPQEWLLQLLGLPRTTINRKIRNDQMLTTDQSERVLGLARLIGQVAAIVQQSGDPAGFNAAAWVSDWIEKPNPALGNRRPAEFMDTLAGQEVLAGLLAQMQTGAYA